MTHFRFRATIHELSLSGASLGAPSGAVQPTALGPLETTDFAVEIFQSF
jgi:hypothetical protein